MKFLDNSRAILGILEKVATGSRVAVYGSGRSGKIIADLISHQRKDLDLRFFIDSFKSGELNGLPVYKREDLGLYIDSIDYIIVASSSWSEIKRNLEQEGIDKYIIVKKEPGFEGWGLTTEAIPPWEEGIAEETFLLAHQDIKQNFLFSGGHNISDDLDNVRWRNWGIAFGVRYALARCKTLNFVECGVGEGMTALVALREARRLLSDGDWTDFRMDLYDSWEAMREEYLLPSEKEVAGEYADLDISYTHSNLSSYRDKLIFHSGFIPDSLHREPAGPESVCFLHIDLNSANPTVAALDHFLPLMSEGSIIVMDDYGLENYRETRLAVNDQLRHRSGQLLPLATGQAYYFI